MLNPVLTGHGSPGEVIWATVTALTGAALLAIGAEGYLFRIGRLTAIERALAVCSGLLLLYRGFTMEAVGAALALTLILSKMIARKKYRTVSNFG